MLGLCHIVNAVSASKPGEERPSDSAEDDIINTTLVPITTNKCGSEVLCNALNVVPQDVVTLDYGLDNDALVEIALVMDRPTIVLEDVPSIHKVDCDLVSKSILIAFNNTADFIAVTDEWLALVDEFILITNHMGDCDSEFERGFFLADVNTMNVIDSSMSVHLFAEPTDAASSGKSMDVFFNNMPALRSRHDTKRGINFHRDGLAIESNVSLGPGFALNNKNDSWYFNVTTSHAQINSSVTWSGALKFSILEMEVKEFWFDVKQSIYYDVGLNLDFKAPITQNLAFKFPVVSYYAINIPGLINLGPELTLGVGARFQVQEQVQLATNFSSNITDGHIVLDLLDSDKTIVDEWNPTYTATANISDSRNVTIMPNVAATVRFTCSIFHGVLDLSTGVTAMTGFPFKFGPTTTQADVDSGNITLPVGELCPNRFGYKKDFAMIIIAFATSWLKKEYPIYEKPIDSGCLPWISP
ncbi:hypothetical protein N0V93_008848 [Gnomoniopsis smithogilvyi]|uniref:DUF7029 domain-containing protein n=1 Tax=Gnomoniopsis smithogilvyi TaxID=1191159 RepID=A0A9W8YNH5_9PEZI|nr:hypothetical protein N0V93_008848 [Gnomoniopsis smithogilvyi]